MRLSKVTLFGFKSFAEKIELHFGAGITAIVGPNGAGKTNLLEAIRWVLGEQSAKLLRGDRMEDVIFKGGEKRKPLSMAEVSLTLTENRGELPIEYEEVTIARRIFRSGESEYLLNKVPCRLRDIADLFLDTGLGNEPYALIDQGLIAFLVGAKPQDLKALLEEAAGIMKYKTRKKAALNKLEATEQNLLRIKDIIQEVERQLQSLKRQAQKAIRYKTLEEQALNLKLYLKLREGLTLKEELERARTEEAAFKEALTAKEASIARLEAALEEARLRDLEREKGIALAQEALYTLKSRLAQGEAEVSRDRSFLQELSRQVEENGNLLQRTRERQRILEETTAEKDSALKQLEEGLLLKERELQQLEANLRGLEKELKGADQAFEAYRRAAVEHALALAERRNRLLSLREQQRLRLRERDRIRAKLDELHLKLGALSEEERALKGVIEGATQEWGILQREREALLQRSSEAGEKLQILGRRIQAVREETAILHSRLASLKALEEAEEVEGAHLLLEEKALGGAGLSDLQGLSPRGYLFELLEVDPPYERAIEALLGEALRGRVTSSLEDALHALAFLKERGGRAILLFPLDSGRERAQQLRETVKAAGVEIEGLAVDLLRSNGLDEALLYTLLGDGVVVKDLEGATALASTLSPPFTIATLEGEVISGRGALTGGTPSPAGPLWRRRQILELKGSLGVKEAEQVALEAEEQAQKIRLDELVQALEVLQGRITEVELRRQGAEKDLLRCQAEKERLDQERDLLSYERKTLEEELTPLERELKIAEGEVQEAEGEEVKLEAEVRSLGEKKAALERRRKELQEEYLAKKVELTVTLERREGFRRDRERFEEELRILREEADRLQGELEALEVRKRELEDAIKGRQEALKILAQQERAQQEALIQDEEARRAIKEQMRNLEEALKPLRRETLELHGELSSRSTKQVELQNAFLRLEEDLREYALTFQELQGRFQEELDPAEVEEELQEVKAKLQSLGPVNLAALEEHEALSQRHRFLAAQAADLEASIGTLKNTIAEIEKTIQRLFRETLSSVNEHFDRLWKRLFGGGGATLTLTGSDDPMNRGLEDGDEPGLKMTLQLPGRRPTTPSLLSGGERSLAVLALLLALLEVKPSPFCILDEVDAPLDDANVERFVALLQELSARHQFIIITHNKRTMEAADALYGITMEDGVSKLISVKLASPA